MIAPATTRVTLPYGAYGEAGYTKENPHAGVDFSWQNDTNIYAPEDATVTRVGYLGTAGESIDLVAGDHKHRMCHLSRYLVSAGQTVKKGQVIGIMGETGQAYGVHLHWVLWVGGVRVNGMDYVNKGEGMFMTDENLLYNYYIHLLKRAPTPTEKKTYIGMPADVVFQTIVDSVEYKNLQNATTEYIKVSDLYIKK